MGKWYILISIREKLTIFYELILPEEKYVPEEIQIPRAVEVLEETKVSRVMEALEEILAPEEAQILKNMEKSTNYTNAKRNVGLY